MGELIEFRNRVQSGVPAGGQFAATLHAEADTELDADNELDAARPDYGVGYDGPDQSHIRVMEDGRGGHVREDGVRGFTCPNCGNGYATQRGVSGHDCVTLESLTDDEITDMATRDAWKGTPATNGDPYYNARYDAVAAAIVEHFPSAPGYATHSATAPAPAYTGAMYEARTGAKFSGYRPLTGIAVDVRADIKAAIKTGVLPSRRRGRDITYSVTKDGGALNITISGLRDRDIYDDERTHPHGDRRKSQMARDIEDRVSNIAAAYNQSRSDSMSDYHDETYYSFVRIHNERDVRADQHDKAQAKLKAEINKARRAGAPRHDIEEMVVRYRSAEDRWTEYRQAYDATELAAANAWQDREREADAIRQAAIDARKAGQ